MPVKSIKSEANAVYKEAKKLATSNRACRKAGMTLAEGIHLGQELLKRPGLVVRVFVREGALENTEVAGLYSSFDSLGLPLIELPPVLFNHIGTVENGAGIVCQIRIPEQPREFVSGDYVYLDGVQDAGNLGTILRTSLAADVFNIALSAKSVYPWSPKALRAGMGAQFAARIYTDAELAVLKRSTGNECIVADARGGRNLYGIDWGKKPSILTMGSEGAGVSEESLSLADQVVLIPINPQIESLNVAVATAVCLFEQKRRRNV